MKLGSRSQLSNFIHLEIQLYTSHYFVAENSCTRRMNKQCPIEHLPRCLLAETRDVTENCALKYHLLPRAHAQGLSVCLSVVCKKKLSNILQVDTSSTYNRNISFANSPILTFVYLIIRNTLQFSVLAGLIIRCSWSSILRYRILNYRLRSQSLLASRLTSCQ